MQIQPGRAAGRKTISIAAGAHRSRVLAARDKLITDHLHLVAPIARRVRLRLPGSFELDDLISEGTLGLMRAAIRYRPQEHGGCPFSAYARPKIHGAIVDSVRRRHFIENTRTSIDFRDEARLGEKRASDSDGAWTIAEGHADPAPPADEALDRSGELKRLRIALARLTDAQQRVLAAWYLETERPKQRAAWRRRRRIAEMHAAAVATLRIEYRSAA